MVKINAQQTLGNSKEAIYKFVVQELESEDWDVVSLIFPLVIKLFWLDIPVPGYYYYYYRDRFRLNPFIDIWKSEGAKTITKLIFKIVFNDKTPENVIMTAISTFQAICLLYPLTEDKKFINKILMILNTAFKDPKLQSFKLKSEILRTFAFVYFSVSPPDFPILQILISYFPQKISHQTETTRNQ